MFRNDDEYDQAISTLLSIGASVLKVFGEKMLEFYNNNDQASGHTINAMQNLLPSSTLDFP